MEKDPNKIRKHNDLELNVFNSFSEAGEFEAKYNAGVSGIDHLTNATILIKQIYLKELLLENDLTVFLK